MTRKKARKNNRILQRRKAKANQSLSNAKEPHCVVLTRGDVSMDLKRLSKEFQKVMEPNVPARLETTKKNVIKDFVSVSAQLGLTHIVTFTQTSLGMYLKLCRIPSGPTITFKIENYTRAKDVLSSLKKQYTHADQFAFSPCVMTNIQTNRGSLHLQTTARMILDMFPTITPDRATPSKIRRCCLFNYDEPTELFELRHYSIRTVPVDVSKGLKKMMGRKVPDLGKFSDVSEYLTKAGMLTDSEAEDDPNARVDLPHKKSQGVALKSSVRLTELGPRMCLRIYKVETGLLGGQVLYHSIMFKTDEEKIALEEKKRSKRHLKEKRRKEQQENVELKKKKKAEHKRRCYEGMPVPTDGQEADDENDDADYYRKEVGEEPDPDFFKKKRKRPMDSDGPPKKFTKDSDGPRPKFTKDGDEPHKKFNKDTDEPRKKFNKDTDEPPRKFKQGFKGVRKAQKDRERNNELTGRKLNKFMTDRSVRGGHKYKNVKRDVDKKRQQRARS